MSRSFRAGGRIMACYATILVFWAVTCLVAFCVSVPPTWLKVCTLASALIVFVACVYGMVQVRQVKTVAGSLAGSAESLAHGNLHPTIPPGAQEEMAHLSGSLSLLAQNLLAFVAEVSDLAQNVAASSEQLFTSADSSAAVTQQIASASQSMASSTQSQSQNSSNTESLLAELNKAIEQIASGAGEQARGMNEASLLTSRMSSSIADVTRLVRTVAEEARKAETLGRQGSDAVSSTVAGMDKIKESSRIVADRIHQLDTLSQKIGEIVNMISDIAGQTNLLALNAAIEAARAGEHGRGFAVVADAVRSLAERSSKATKEISSLISEIQNGTRAAVSAIDEGMRAVDTGTSLTGQAGAALEQIITAVMKTSEQIQSMAGITEEMSSGAKSTVEAMDRVAAVTEENSAAAQQMSAASSQATAAVSAIAKEAEQNAAAAEQVSASTEEMSSSIQEIASSTQALAKMAQKLQGTIARFQTQ